MRVSLSKQPRMTREQALAAQPIRNMGVEWNEADEGEIRIVVKPRQDRTFRILRWFFPPPPERHIFLDEVGAEVWRLCDGRTTVEQIIRRMAKRYKLNLKEAETSTTEYLRRLGKKRLVGFAIPKKQSHS